MDVEKNKKTFQYLCSLFVEIGEKRLGRELSYKEVDQIMSTIAQKCKNIKKEDIVTQIYNLELAKLEKLKGPVSSKDKRNLRKHISKMTNSSFKTHYKSSSDVLTKVVANEFTNIHMKDEFEEKPSLRLESKEEIQTHRKTLRASYANNFSYTAPKSLSDKIRKYIALGLVGASAISIIGYEKLFKEQTTPSKEGFSSSEISDKTEDSKIAEPHDFWEDLDIKIDTPENYIKTQLKYRTPIEQFKYVFIREYNQHHFMEGYNPEDITVLSESYDYFYKATSPSHDDFYILPGHSPELLESILEYADFKVEKVGDKDNSSEAITITDQEGNFVASCALIDGKYVPITSNGNDIVNNSETFYENPELYLSSEDVECTKKSLVPLCETLCFDALLVDSHNFEKCLSDYVAKNPNTAYSSEVRYVLTAANKSEAQGVEAYLQRNTDDSIKDNLTAADLIILSTRCDAERNAEKNQAMADKGEDFEI